MPDEPRPEILPVTLDVHDVMIAPVVTTIHNNEEGETDGESRP